MSVATSPAGKWLLIGRYSGELSLRNRATGEEKAKYVAHMGNVYGVTFAPDGRIAASAGGGQTVDGKPDKGEDFIVRVWKLDE